MHTVTPQILKEGTYDALGLERFLKGLPEGYEKRDILARQLPELFKVLHPDLLYASNFSTQCDLFVDSNLNVDNPELAGDWIYFPWSHILLHSLGASDLALLRTNRNRDLITVGECERLLSATIAFVGLSVGGHMATTMAYGAIGGHFKLADFDILETSNLNRVRARLVDVGASKIAITAQAIYDIHPHAKLSLFPEGLTEETLPHFLDEPKPEIIFEAIDDFRMKILLRLKAREAGIPVVMLTSIGDNILIDIERYDLDPSLPLFHGLISQTPEEILRVNITPEKEKEYAVAIVGRDHVSARAIASLKEIGHTLVGRPQLASTVFINGGVASYIARRILLEDLHISGRFFVQLDALLSSPQ